MATLYEDSSCTCDDDAITIHLYYFPLGSKRIPYKAIRKVTEEKMDFWGGAARLWGMGFTPQWFHFDPKRWSKTQCIVIEEADNWVQSIVTPEDHDRVLSILREKTFSLNE